MSYTNVLETCIFCVIVVTSLQSGRTSSSVCHILSSLESNMQAAVKYPAHEQSRDLSLIQYESVSNFISLY